MKKAIYYDYGSGAADLIIEGLEKSGKYKFPVWIDNVELFFQCCQKEERKPLRVPDFSWHKLREGDVGAYKYLSDNQELKKIIYEKYFYKFLLQASREDIKSSTNIAVYKDRTPFHNSTVYSLQNVFYILVNFYFTLINEHSIEMVYFNDITHDGSDIVLYAIAKELGLEIFIAHRTIAFPDKFFCVDSNDFLDYRNLPSLKAVEPYINLLGAKAKPAYKAPPLPNIITDEGIDDYIKVKYLIKKPKKYFKYMRRMLKAMLLWPSKTRKYEIYQQLRAITEYLNYRRYVDNLTNMQEDRADFDSKFVFFPLHMQPEATTLAIGEQYFDQILALEAISDLIPRDWTIYIKDHYLSQREYMRDESFWIRLKGIKNVKLLSGKVNTYELIEKAQFVATVTGTAGFEALLASKRVLVFGEAWYKHFTGVSVYNDNLTIDDILSCEVDHSKLCKDIGLLESKLYEGATDCDYGALSGNYSLENNVENRVKSLLQIFASRIK